MRRLATYGLLLAVLLVGLIPSGWMPVSHDGKTLLVLCTAEGVQEVLVDLEGQGPDHPQHEDRSCPFGALQPLALFEGTALPLRLEPVTAVTWSREAFTHHTAGFHWRYDARGPPALS